MSKNVCKMTGMILMIISVFLLMAGLYLPQAGISGTITIPCLVTGMVILLVGIIFYKILKNE